MANEERRIPTYGFERTSIFVGALVLLAGSLGLLLFGTSVAGDPT